jgi:hypothetical protein
MGSTPGTVYCIDVSDTASYYIKEKLKIKVAKWGTPKKNIKKRKLTKFTDGWKENCIIAVSDCVIVRA